MINYEQLEEDIKENRFSPENIFYLSLKSMEHQLQPNNATMPLIALLEHQSVCASVNSNEIDIVNKYLNPAYCDTHEGLARHLDYTILNTIHAIPSHLTKATIAIGMDDLRLHGVDIGEGKKRVIIPEDTVVGHSDSTYFGLHHPISITMMDNDTIDINYIDTKSPLMTLNNPIIESRLVSSRDLSNQYETLILEMDVDLYQFRRTYHSFQLTQGTGFNKTVTIDDQYYHARIYTRLNNSWVELDTYFSEFIYNAYSSRAAAVVKLEGTNLTIDIPQIFFTRGLVGSEVKVVVYTTKGDNSEDYSLSLPTDFSIAFENQDSSILRYTAPLESFSTVYAYSRGKCIGGRNIPSVEELRAMIMVSDDEDQPITEDQLKHRLESLGYNVTEELNYVSDNLFVASKRLNEIDLDGVKTLVAGGSFDLILQDLDDKAGVFNNGYNYTISPDALFKEDNGIVSILTQSDKSAIESLPLVNLVDKLNEETYLSTPFYYLIEKLDYNRRVSVFDLDSPEVPVRQFVGTNPASVGRINTGGYTITKTSMGYRLRIVAICNDSFKEYEDDSFVVQLTRRDDKNRLFSINANFIERGDDGEFIFEFDFNTSYDISYLNTIIISNFMGSLNAYPAKLLDTFKLTFNLVKQLPVASDSAFKEYTDASKLPSEYQTITYEEMTIKFGEQLTVIYRPTKTFPGKPRYVLHTEDVPAYYKEDIFETDEQGYMVMTKNPDYPSVPDAQPILYNKLHSKGEPIMLNGEQVYKARKGTIVYDENNQPVTDGKERHNIQTKFVLIDYKYRLISNYWVGIKNEILDNIASDIEPLTKRMLGLTELEYNLSTSVGSVGVRYDSDSYGVLDANMSFDIVVTVDEVTYEDGSLRTIITNNIKSVIGQYVKGNQFAINKLTSLINSKIEDSVTSFHINRINGRDDITNFRLEKDSDTMGVKSRLTIGADNKVALTDDIQVRFKLG